MRKGNIETRTTRRAPSGAINSSEVSGADWGSSMADSGTGRNSRRRGGAARDVVGHVGGKNTFQLPGHGAGRGGKAMTFEFSHRQEIPVGRRNEHFVGSVKIFRAERFIDESHAGFRAH